MCPDRPRLCVYGCQKETMGSHIRVQRLQEGCPCIVAVCVLSNETPSAHSARLTEETNEGWAASTLYVHIAHIIHGPVKACESRDRRARQSGSRGRAQLLASYRARLAAKSISCCRCSSSALSPLSSMRDVLRSRSFCCVLCSLSTSSTSLVNSAKPRS